MFGCELPCIIGEKVWEIHWKNLHVRLFILFSSGAPSFLYCVLCFLAPIMANKDEYNIKVFVAFQLTIQNTWKKVFQ